MLRKVIGSRLKTLRLSKNDSLRSLAEKINVSYSTLYKIETGENYPSIEVLEKLAQHFDVEKSYFFGEKQGVPDPFKDKVKWVAFGEKVEQYSDIEPDELWGMLERFLKKLGDK